MTIQQKEEVYNQLKRNKLKF